MKRFDPSVGWIDPASDDPATPAPSSVYHFNRQGQRLNVTHVEDGPAPNAPAGDEPASPAVQRMREAARAPQRPLRAPAETAGMVRELFERLDEADPTQALMARDPDLAEHPALAGFDIVSGGELERVLADIAQEMEHLQAQVHADLDAARDSEDRNLKLRQYRRELLDQLAQRLPAAGTP